jgi:hypothetical protein
LVFRLLNYFSCLCFLPNCLWLIFLFLSFYRLCFRVLVQLTVFQRVVVPLFTRLVDPLIVLWAEKAEWLFPVNFLSWKRTLFLWRFPSIFCS